MTGLEERRKIVVEYMKLGMSIREMASKLSVNRGTIRSDMDTAPFYIRWEYRIRSRKHR